MTLHSYAKTGIELTEEIRNNAMLIQQSHYETCKRSTFSYDAKCVTAVMYKFRL